MNIKDFDYSLPPELIAHKPAEPRDTCRLLVVNKNSGSLSISTFSEISKFLGKNICLVMNDTKVFPARILGTKDTGGAVEILLLRQTKLNSYICIGRGKMQVGTSITFSPSLIGEITSKNHEGEMNIEFNLKGADLLSEIDKIGHTPLPPYIKTNQDEKQLRQQYQTVYARHQGSAAAPTAGLHFTPSLLSSLKEKGVQIEYVTLHVGLGTFKPITETQIMAKKLHVEPVFLAKEVADRLNQAKQSGKRIIAVGTTSLRLLESFTRDNGVIEYGEKDTDIFIQPGYKFKFVDGLITNFHLPQTSLLMLVAALVSAPNTKTEFHNFSDSIVGKAYSEAIKNKMKFFSFGDAMLIV